MRAGALSVLALAQLALVCASHSALEQHYAKRGLRSKSDVARSLDSNARNVRIVKRVNNATASELDACPGYTATNVKTTSHSLTANLHLAGPACNVYGSDLTALNLQVTYETCERF